jgi:hypothetical protein
MREIAPFEPFRIKVARTAALGVVSLSMLSAASLPGMVRAEDSPMNFARECGLDPETGEVVTTINLENPKGLLPPNGFEVFIVREGLVITNQYSFSPGVGITRLQVIATVDQGPLTAIATEGLSPLAAETIQSCTSQDILETNTQP